MLASSAALPLILALAGLVGCTDGIMVPVDASADGGEGGQGAQDGGASLPVDPPDIPWLADGVPPIMLTPCPEGWREVVGGAVTECDPYPAAGPESCARGEAHFPGEVGCRPVGAACPLADYATSLPTGGSVVYVNASASPGGDGTVAAPFATLSEVSWGTLAASTTVALAKGTYAGTLPLKAGMSVVGACAAETVVTGTAARVVSVVTVANAGDPAVVQNLTIRDAPQRGVMVDRGRRLSLRGVVIVGATGLGVYGSGAGSEVSLTDVVVRDTKASATSAGEFGTGVFLQLGARVEATRLIVMGNRGVSVLAMNEGSSLALADTVVRGTQPDADGNGGRGINMQGGARLDATRLLVTGNRTAGVLAAGVGSTVSMSDAIIRGTVPRVADGTGGGALVIEFGAELSAARLAVANNHGVALFVDGGGSRAALTDVVVRDTQPDGREWIGGRGVSLQSGAHFEATRFLVTGNAESGMLVEEPGTTMLLTDAVIQRTAPNAATDGIGRAVSVQLGARLEASRLLIADNRELGLLSEDEGTVVILSDVIVRDTHPRLRDDRLGRGLQAQNGARIEGLRIEVDRSFEVGVVARSAATVVLSDTSIRTVVPARCSTSTCLVNQDGHAVAALSASLSMSRFHLMDAAVCGVLVSTTEPGAEAPSVDLDSGEVTVSAIGACVQVDGYDLGRLTNGVHYRDNGTNLDATSMPVPDIAESLGR